MKRATPLKGTTEIHASGTVETADCSCGRGISRARHARRDDSWWSWIHVGNGRIYCTEEKK